MKNKTMIAVIFLWLVLIATTVVAMLDTKEVKKELTDYDVCYGSGVSFEQQVTACGNVIKDAQNWYWFYKAKMDWLADQASGARNKIQEATKTFYDNNLSGTNVNFITTK